MDKPECKLAGEDGDNDCIKGLHPFVAVIDGEVYCTECGEHVEIPEPDEYNNFDVE